jgi:class 3 adenylate cyclase
MRYQDTLLNLNRDRDLSSLDAAYKLEKKQNENDRLRLENVAQQRLLLAVGVSACIALAFVVFLFRMNAHKRRTNEQLQLQQQLLEDQAQEIELTNQALHEAHERSETLIRNTMPVSIANRLKSGETKIAERFENVCILFADIVGFTELASRLEPVVLVAVLDEIFTAFDAIAARFGLEKIKTMGDAYMLVAGVPESIAAPAETLALAALAMQEEIILKTDALRRTNIRLQVRIGIHAGEVIAGVIGTTKLVYDIWGDAVNIAHRMESHGIAGQIQVSEAFVQCFNTSIQEQIDASRKRLFAYPAMKSALPSARTLASTPHEQAISSSIIDTATAFIFEERGLIDMKGKGAMKAYLLSARSMNADV